MCSCLLAPSSVILCANDLWVFTLRSTSTLYLSLPYFLQQGETPVMLAAGKGHTGVVDLLVHKDNCSLTEVGKVSAFDVLGCQSSVGVSCQCLCLAVTVKCHSACSHVVRDFAGAINR